MKSSLAFVLLIFVFIAAQASPVPDEEAEHKAGADVAEKPKEEDVKAAADVAEKPEKEAVKSDGFVKTIRQNMRQRAQERRILREQRRRKNQADRAASMLLLRPVQLGPQTMAFLPVHYF